MQSGREHSSTHFTRNTDRRRHCHIDACSLDRDCDAYSRSSKRNFHPAAH